jgi:hypothetical protein
MTVRSLLAALTCVVLWASPLLAVISVSFLAISPAVKHETQ